MARQHRGANEPARSWSLRREWSRAFTTLLVLVLLASAATVIGVHELVGDFNGSSRLLARESSAVSTLRSEMNAHEDAGHLLLGGAPESHETFLRQQDRISDAFTTARRAFPDGDGSQTVITSAERSWRAALTGAGLWGHQLAALTHAELAAEAPFGTASDRARSRLDSLQNLSLHAMQTRLASGERLERALLALLALLFGTAFGVTVYFRRRMITDLVRPIATLHEGVQQLRDGAFGHRIVVSRHDELGELADAFNAMADALHSNHIELTLRATHDSLTGLANRASLLERLSTSFAPGSDRRARREAVLFIDIDDFKDVNDSVGHEGGDALLVQLAARLIECVRPHDLVARIGGDEFAIVVVEDDTVATAVDVSTRILGSMEEPFIVGGTRLDVSVSIGIAQRRPTTADATELLRHADFAMYMAKGSGKHQQQVFDARAHTEMVRRSARTAELALATSAARQRPSAAT